MAPWQGAHSRSAVAVGAVATCDPGPQVVRPWHTRSPPEVAGDCASNCSPEHSVSPAHTRLEVAVGFAFSCSSRVHAVCGEHVVNECWASARYCSGGQPRHTLPCSTHTSPAPQMRCVVVVAVVVVVVVVEVVTVAVVVAVLVGLVVGVVDGVVVAAAKHQRRSRGVPTLSQTRANNT